MIPCSTSPPDDAPQGREPAKEPGPAQRRSRHHNNPNSDLQTLRARLNARVEALDTRSKAALGSGGKLDYAAMLEATRLQTALDVLTEYADVALLEAEAAPDPLPAFVPISGTIWRPTCEEAALYAEQPEYEANPYDGTYSET